MKTRWNKQMLLGVILQQLRKYKGHTLPTDSSAIRRLHSRETPLDIDSKANGVTKHKTN
ncbi:uncharacterized protein G2W53_005195 [Senna tora]|uniref:Uncharacterized protein n=1 Tax=Senna tora TaxID=362788 RepID=A0A835CKZ4_9FABA|nr:uncharacterized protein G2W53_005195 [Senna tora]